MTYPVKEFDGQFFVELYLPARTAVVLKEGKIRKPAKVTKAKPAKEETPAAESKPKTTRKRTVKKTAE
jgi:hypothetical protein